MKIVRYFVSIIFIVFVCNFSFAHNPDEINYDFVIDDEKQELTIHFTPVAAFHLIQELRVELRMKRIIKLENYLTYFEAYFNETINLKIGDSPVYFRLTKNNLTGHEATMTFKIENVNLKGLYFDVSVTSFTEIFPRIKNDVLITTFNKSHHFYFNKSNTNSSFKVVKVEEASINKYIMVGVFLLILVFVIKNRSQMQKSHPTSVI